jgi:hypothetical protein
MKLFGSLHYLSALLLCANGLYAQHKIAGKVVSSDGRTVEAVVSLFAGDSLVGATLTNEKGSFAFGELKAATYRLTILEADYQPVTDSVALSADLNKNYTLFPIATLNLEEVTVTADRSNIVRQTATGSIFRLSNTAKNRNNAFDALTEIPELVVNVAERSVKLNSGITPLILVNGVRSANGINNIDPKDIESVEVIQVPSAQYIGEAEAALNVKISRKQYGYYLANLSSRHSLPGVFGFSSAGLETGGEKYMFYFTGDHFYFNNDAIRFTSTQENAGYQKTAVADGNYNSKSRYAALGGDYVFSAKDYLSYTVTYLSNPSSTDRHGTGVMDAVVDDVNTSIIVSMRSLYETSVRRSDESYINTYNLYHSHTFDNNSKLESTLHLNFNANQTSGETSEKYDNREDYHYLYEYDNFRTSSSLYMNYGFKINDHSANIGSRTRYREDRLKRLTAPVFRYRELDEYLYAELSGSLNKRFNYMVSAGAEAIINRSAGHDNYYYTWASSASLLYSHAAGNSMRLSYTKTNIAPAINYLNPYNISSDTLYRVVGNPYLRPVKQHQFAYEYIYNKNGIYISPQLRYRQASDYIVQTGSNNGNIYTQTYANDSRFSEIDGRLTLRYSNNRWGSIGGSVGYRSADYSSVDRSTFYANANANAHYKRVSAYGYLTYQKYSYNPVTVIRNLAPECELTVSWMLNNIVTLNGGLRYFLGMTGTESVTENAGYRSTTLQNMTERQYMASLGVSINLRSKLRKNRNEKRLYQDEQGIDLK